MIRVNQRMESQPNRGFDLGATQPDLPRGYFFLIKADYD